MVACRLFLFGFNSFGATTTLDDFNSQVEFAYNETEKPQQIMKDTFERTIHFQDIAQVFHHVPLDRLQI